MLANVAWLPLYFVAAQFDWNGQDQIQFWQVYFVTTPHRWVTLGLVFLDSRRFHGQRWLFSGLAAGVVLLCLGVQLTTGQLTCLLAIDYLWNAWHFSAQHHGIYRVYDRMSAVSSVGTAALLEKWLLRGYLLYVIFRVAGTTWADPDIDQWFAALDIVAFLLPCGLIARELFKSGTHPSGRTFYLLSVLALYSTLLWVVHTRQLSLVLLLTTLSALFHATEYLAIVSWSVDKRSKVPGQQTGILGWLAPRWGYALAVYVVILGSAGWMIEQGWFELWLLINVIVAFLHYAYDGLIWRQGGGQSTTASSGLAGVSP
ncbi:MAG: hypothetical protein C0478_10325 [Planctomyces sp.]|nr:hypothetical protein [Planctomyces sp.]